MSLTPHAAWIPVVMRALRLLIDAITAPPVELAKVGPRYATRREAANVARSLRQRGIRPARARRSISDATAWVVLVDAAQAEAAEKIVPRG